jgi:Tfp pilus assembly protein PilX
MIKFFKKINKNKYKNKKKGVALVIAVTTMSLLLSISFSISNIVLRQIRITNINNQSKPAFYIADSALECAFYWDTVNIPDVDTGENINENFSTAVFGTSTDAATNNIKCGIDSGTPLGLTKTLNNDQTVVVTKFDINYGNNSCAQVEVRRTEVETKITARGYNTGINANGNGCDLSDLNTRRLVERGLTITY